MTHVRFPPQQDRPAGQRIGGGMLQRGAHLAGMQRIHPGIALEYGEKDRRVPGPLAHMMIRRVRQQPAKLHGIGGGPVLVVPCLAEPEALVTHHVEQRCRAHHGRVEFRPLSQCGAD